MRQSAPGTATRPKRGGTALVRRRTLLVISGDAIETREIPLAGDVTIGRGSDAEVRITEPSLSRAHLRLQLTEEAVQVIDLGGANGTTLRGVPLPPHVPVQIVANEPIGAGDLTLVIQEIGAIARPVAARPARPSGRLASDRPDPVVLEPAMRRLYELAARVARGTIPLLLIGETGTGKEVLAEFVHAASPRAGRPLVRINCAALSDTLVESELFGHEKGAFTGALRERAGLLETASGGTAFLDEIGELPLRTQAKLLRVLEEGTVLRVGASEPTPIDVRFVAATNRDLEVEVEAGRFRRDLYFRLAAATLHLGPLRERCLEIEALAHRFAAQAARRLDRAPPSISEAALVALRAHGWPGNVRELRNVIERAVLLAESSIDVEHLPDLMARPRADHAVATTPVSPAAEAAGATTLAGELARIEKTKILDALERCGENQTRAAALLGMPRRTLIKRLREYGIKRPRR
jgi:DNA-binding NtrC family response regulator